MIDYDSLNDQKWPFMGGVNVEIFGKHNMETLWWYKTYLKLILYEQFS